MKKCPVCCQKNGAHLPTCPFLPGYIPALVLSRLDKILILAAAGFALMMLLSGCAPKIIERRVPPLICFSSVTIGVDGKWMPTTSCFDARDVADWLKMHKPPLPPDTPETPETLPNGT